MYDSTTATDIPVSAQIVGGYVDGLYRWSDADWARFPNAVKVRIAVFRPTDDGHVLDVESGNATPAESVDWVLMRRAAGMDPSVYMNESTWPQVRQAFQARGVAEPHYWVAIWDNVPEFIAGAVAKQYANSSQAGGHYDLSEVADFWPGVDVSMVVVKHLVSAVLIPGKVLAGAKWFNWGDAVNGNLVPVVGYPDPTVDQAIEYQEFVQFSDGRYFDRIPGPGGPGDWCIDDDFINTRDVAGCLNPQVCFDKFNPPPPPPPPPALTHHVHDLTVTVNGQAVVVTTGPDKAGA
jgi:hypothetical protein